MAVYNTEDMISNVEQYGRKMKLLEVMRIVEQETDTEHMLTANQIATKLEQRGFSKPDRKGIYDDINVLNYFFKPANKRKSNQASFIAKDEETFGYYMENRLFSVADLKLMIDAIQSSKFLSEAKTVELIESLETLCSTHQAKQLKRQVVVSNRVKNMNTNIHSNVDHINAAIDADVSIRFRYFDYGVKMERIFRRKGGWYEVSPLLLVYSDDNYYLVGYDHRAEEVRNFRVDRMAHLSGTSNLRIGKELFTKEDLGLYQRYAFNMYSGKVEKVTMRFRNNMMNAVIDKFGKQDFVKCVDAEHFEITVPVAVSPQFYGWVFGLGNYVTIIGPECVKKQMVDTLKKVKTRYE